jgi:hypothetical protein
LLVEVVVEEIQLPVLVQVVEVPEDILQKQEFLSHPGLQ